MVLLLRVVSWAACALRGGCLSHDFRAAGSAPATGQRGDGWQLRLASPTGKGVHGRCYTQSA